MSNTNNDSSLVRLLKVINNLTPTEILAAISHTIKDITTSAPLLIEFNLFLLNVHDILVSEFTDSSILAEIYRVIRYCLSSPDYCDLIVSQDIHWIIVASVERDDNQTYLSERVQAIKVMKQCLVLSPSKFPESFARSLVAMATCKDESFRKLSLEMLRELCVLNPDMTSRVNGFRVLLDAVIDPDIDDILSETILMSLLYLLTSSNSRQYSIDVLVLLSPLTDLDSNIAEMEGKWKKSISAFILLMKSVPGIIILASDRMGLNVFVRMLTDPKVSSVVQAIILDGIYELFSPILSRNVEVVPKPKSSAANASSMTPSHSSTSVSVLSPQYSPQQSLRNIYKNSPTPTPANSSHSNPTAKLSSGGGLFSSLLSSFSSIASPNGHNNRADVKKETNRRFQNDMTRPMSVSLSNMDRSSVTTMDNRSGMSIEKSFSTSYDGLLSTGKRHSYVFPATPLIPEDSPIDPLYNAMDGYAALLCCAFIHAELFRGLCLLGTAGDAILMSRSRELLLDVLQVATKLFPASKCAEFLRVPELIDFATAISSNADPYRSHKATGFLVSIANEFSAANMYRKRDYIVSSVVKEDYANDQVNQARRPTLLKLRSMNPYRTFDAARDLEMESDYSQPLPPNSSYMDVRPSSPGRSVRNTGVASMSHSFPDLTSVIADITKGVQSLSAIEFHKTAEFSKEFFSIPYVAKTLRTYCSNQNSRLDDVNMNRVCSLVAPADKTEFLKQLDKSLVTDRDLKMEPLKWNWDVIKDVLDFSFAGDEVSNTSTKSKASELVTGRLGEAIRVKWVKRVFGFYRCSMEDGSGFHRLAWDPDNLLYVECGCALYVLLLKQGITTLTDRKGSLLEDIYKELDVLVSSTSVDKKISEPLRNSVFSVDSVNSTLAREYFTFLGKVAVVALGRNALIESKIPKLLLKLSSKPSLDYLSRLAITTLLFTDNFGNPSKALISEWLSLTAQDNSSVSAYSWNCSSELRYYVLSLLRILIHSRESEFMSWGMDLVFCQISNIHKFYGDMKYGSDEKLCIQVLNILQEAFKNRTLISTFFKSHATATMIMETVMKFSTLASESFLLRVLSVDEGYETLMQIGWLNSALDQWTANKCSEYVYNIDFALAKSLNRGYWRRVKSSYGSPINVPVAVLCKSTSDVDIEQEVDLEGLVRMPWNLKVKLSTMNGSANLPLNVDDYIRTDCFLDTSELLSPYNTDILSDAARVVKIRAIVIDQKGMPSGYAIGTDKIIHTSLLCGVCPVLKDGTIVQISDSRLVSSNKYKKRSNLMLDKSSNNRIRSYSSASISTPSAASKTNMAGILSESSGGATRLENELKAKEGRRQHHHSALDHLFDWSVCKPGHRGVVSELEGGRFSVEVPGEPVVWIFSRVAPQSQQQPQQKQQPKSKLEESLFNMGRTDSSRVGMGFTYLVEIQYLLRLETKTALFVPCPRHIFGELGRTRQGSEMIVERGILQTVLAVLRNEKGDVNARRAALWNIGHLCSTSHGFKAVFTMDEHIISYLIKLAVSCENFSIRGTALFALGLLGKSSFGTSALLAHQWESSPVKSAAVAVPQSISVLFTYNRDVDDPVNPRPRTEDMGLFRLLYPFLPGGKGDEIEVLSNISKLPGQVLYKESLTNLQRIKKLHPKIYEHRNLYIAAQKMMSTYTFSLGTRRIVLGLFDPLARCKSKNSVAIKPAPSSTFY